MTMLELVATVSEFTSSETELVATVAALVNSGTVELCGNFRGARIAFGPEPEPAGRSETALSARRGGRY